MISKIVNIKTSWVTTTHDDVITLHQRTTANDKEVANC